MINQEMTTNALAAIKSSAEPLTFADIRNQLFPDQEISQSIDRYLRNCLKYLRDKNLVSFQMVKLKGGLMYIYSPLE